ncbi:transmembrane protein 220-like [Patiria miniata]|uniref:Transmembrane protein 220 n=1 Tax=Patiria miniata TaxID=46514 RepID=A0A914AYM2_PATMI|nr:transmembrane protein 220-like [Patiria miniata]XP_038068629.1 transmembrane protein 220-like [Patiria miniata]
MRKSQSSKSQSSVTSNHSDGSGSREITGPQSWLWAGINAVMAVFFALAAFVQINDPDPYIWVPIYAIPCLLCCSIVWSRDSIDHKYWRVTAAIHMCFAVFGIVLLTFQVGQVHRKEGLFNPLSLEEGRELFGLLIALGWTLMCWFSGHIMTTCSTGKLTLLTGIVVLLGMMPLALWGTCYQADFEHCNDML